MGDLEHMARANQHGLRLAPALLGDAREDLVERGTLLCPSHCGLCGRPRRDRLERIALRDLALPCGREIAPDVRGHPHRDAEDEAPLLVGVDARELLREDEEHALGGVVGLGRPHAEAPKRTPHELVVLDRELAQTGMESRVSQGFDLVGRQSRCL